MDQNERAQVEQVFALTGGELNDQPFQAWSDASRDGAPLSFAYNYDGAPEYSDLPDRYETEYITIVSDCLFGSESDVLYQANGVRWIKVASFRSSGETECPCKQGDCDGDDDRPCPLCEAQQGEAHGYVYLGDGWCETVYRRAARRPIYRTRRDARHARRSLRAYE